MDDPRPEGDTGAAEPRHATPNHQTLRVRCVAVTASDADAPAALREAMRRRGVELIGYRSVYDALLAVLSENAGATAVVFVDPAAFPNDQPARMAQTLARHSERVTLWRFDDGRLRPFDPPAARDDAFEPAPPVASTPRLRLAGFHDDEASDDVPEPEESADTPGELLTGEEIAMLLDESADDENGREEHQA